MNKMPRPLRIFLLSLMALLATYPFFGEWLFPEKHTFLLQKLTSMMIMAVLAMSLDLLVGVGGLVSMGHAAFFGFGGYLLALLSPEYSASNLWIVLPLSVIAVGLAAAVIGLLSIQTTGIYFIMVTLAFGQMGFYFFNDSPLAGGSDGTYIMVLPDVSLSGVPLLNLSNKVTQYYVGFLALAGVYLLLRVLLSSPFGRVLAGIGVNEDRVRALGFNPNQYKLAAFVISGMIAGFAGFLAAIQYGFVNPSTLSWHHSGEALIMVILGGMGTLFGPALGAFVYELARMLFESITEYWLILMGAMILSIVLLLPKGVGGLLIGLFSRGKTANSSGN